MPWTSFPTQIKEHSIHYLTTVVILKWTGTQQITASGATEPSESGTTGTAEALVLWHMSSIWKRKKKTDEENNGVNLTCTKQ